MPLLERYLDAVGRHLPADKEADILAELRDDIQARLDERSALLGRGLTEAEEAEVLRPYGRPILMASRYAPQRQLVGPDWFPFYWTTLEIALAIAFIAHVAVLVSLAVAARPTGAAVERLVAFPTGTALTVFAWVTLVFAVLERTSLRARFKDNWNPRALPRAAARGSRPSRLGVAIELVVDAVFVTWWTAVHQSADLLRLPPVLQLAPSWPTLYWPVLVMVLASMLAKCVVLVRPDWSVFRLGAGLLVTAGGIAVAGLALRAGPLVLPGQPGSDAQQLSELLNMVLRWSIAAAIVIAVMTTAFDIWRWGRNRRRRLV
jgi:hypothetical protein